MKKSFFSSWTIWFGICQVALGFVGLLSGLGDSGETSVALIITGLTSIGLRMKTTQPVV